MDLFFIRHLPTEYNLTGLLQGSLDISITDVPDVLAEKVSKIKQDLSSIEFDSVYCSELVRTRQTANFFGYKNLCVDARINELNFGTYEGQAKDKLLTDHGDAWLNNPFNLTLGEPLNSFAERVDDFISSIKPLSNVLVFSHGVVGRYIAAKYIHKDINMMNQFHINNSDLLKIQL